MCHCDNVKLLWCGICKSVKYCSRDCQKADWPHHKTECSADHKDKAKTAKIIYRKFMTKKMGEFLAAIANYARVKLKVKDGHLVCTINSDDDGNLLATVDFGDDNQPNPFADDLRENSENVVLLVYPGPLPVVLSFDYIFGQRSRTKYEHFLSSVNRKSRFEINSKAIKGSDIPFEAVTLFDAQVATNILVL